MGEKRAYKPRKPGGGRRKSKPEYDAGKILKELMNPSVVLYEEGMSLQAIADELGLNPIKVRKLLITAGVYVSDVAEKVQETFDDFRKTQDHKAAVLSTANALGLSRSSVTSYLPYKKGVYFPCTAPADKISVGAERQRRYRAMRRCRDEWDAITFKAACYVEFFFFIIYLYCAILKTSVEERKKKATV